MSRNRVVWLAIALVAAITLACVNLGGSSLLPTGESAPNFGMKVEGKMTTLNDLRDNVVIVSFWSSV